MADIDTTNKFAVGSYGKGIVLFVPPRLKQILSYDEALTLAAYLVSVAKYGASHTFEDVLAAVQST